VQRSACFTALPSTVADRKKQRRRRRREEEEKGGGGKRRRRGEEEEDDLHLQPIDYIEATLNPPD